ncbi:unnamed protein product [Lasius platythorax]|uniref:Uncharacterized protein n=1 Tax=Lasius platythorax TaxID=488582 RepID=A0AAV2NVF6_9HYME
MNRGSRNVSSSSIKVPTTNEHPKSSRTVANDFSRGAGFFGGRYRRDDRLSLKGMMMDIIGNCLVPHQFCQRLQVGGKLVGVSVL